MESQCTKFQRNGPSRWITPVFVFIGRCSVVAVVLFVGLMLYSLLVPGWFLSRPVPSKAEYLAHYMKSFDPSQIEKIDYCYEGAVGGERTIAEVHFKGTAQIQVRAGDAELGTYNPAALAEEPAASEFREQWTFAAGGRLPSWFDFPYKQRMRIVREARKVPSDGKPSYRFEWYIDDQRNVVYFRGIRG